MKMTVSHKQCNPFKSVIQTIECPYSGGHLVFEARAMLASIGDSTVFDDESVCMENDNYRMSHKNEKGSYGVIAYPNPIKESCRFIYNLPKDEKGRLLILDCLGKVIYENDVPINSSSYNIVLKGLAVGVYSYSLKGKSGSVGNGKLILVK